MLNDFSNYSNIRRLEIVPTVKICFKTHDIWLATLRFGDTTCTRRCWRFASWWPNTLLSQWTLNTQVFVFFDVFVFVFVFLLVFVFVLVAQYSFVAMDTEFLCTNLVLFWKHSFLQDWWLWWLESYSRYQILIDNILGVVI